MRTVETGIKNVGNEEYILRSVLGQLSDGIWENSDCMTWAWVCANVGTDCDGYVEIHLLDDSIFAYGNRIMENRYYMMSDELVRKYFAVKLQQIVQNERGYKDEEERKNYRFVRGNMHELGFLYGKDYCKVTIDEVVRLRNQLLRKVG